MVERPPTQRLFFALWPSDAQRQAMVDWIDALGLGQQGRPVSEQNLHITLVFLGDTPLDRVDCIISRAAPSNAASFVLRFDRLGYFRRAQVLWAGVSHLPPVLARLHHELEQALVPCGYRPEPREFTPHLTLRRKVARKPELPADPSPLLWPIDQFCLVSSMLTPAGAEYSVVKRYPLGAPNTDRMTAESPT